MRRYARSLILIAVLVTLAGVILGIQKITIGDFERGGDTILGLSLGLDLQGGIDLRYRAVDSATGEPITPEKNQMESLKRSIEERVNASGLGEPNIQLLGDDRLLVQLPGVDDPDRAKSLIGETAQLVFKHRMLTVPRSLDEEFAGHMVSVTAGTLQLDEEGRPTVLPPGATTTPVAVGAQGEGEPAGQSQGAPVLVVEYTEEGAERFAEVVARLIQSLAPVQSESSTPRSYASSLDVSIEGTEPLRVEVTALSILRIGTSTRFAFTFPFPQAVQPSVVSDAETAQTLLGDSPVVHLTEIQGKVDEDIGLTGDDLATAYADTHSGSGLPIVIVEFKSRGTRIWGDLTSRLAGSQTDEIAILLDEQELISPQVITAITAGVTQISGNFTLQRARDLALLLEAGSLPVTIELIEERDVDAILGADSLRESVVAGLVGLALILLFMTLYYRVPGVVASVALLIYASLVLAIFKMLGLTLNLPGVAAIILSIGMAVDANILIFERMKDELRAGRTLLSAINLGFNRAWPAIRDGNVSTLITCGILFWFSDQLGETIVQGFAAALAIGVLVSMFSAITVSRTFLRVMAATPLARRLGLFDPAGEAQLPQRPQEAASAAQRSSS